jgi:radical SAM superfamily enzyme
MNPDTDILGAEVFIQTSAISLETKVFQFTAQDSKYCFYLNCPERHSDNISKGGKTFCVVAGTHDCTDQEAK